jgi:hypothetical protein
MDSKTHCILQKPTDAIVMMPRTGKLTPVTRKVYNALLHRTQTEVIVLREQGRAVDATYLFSAPLHEVLKQTLREQSKSDNMTSVKGYFMEMRRTEVDWEAPDASSGVVWRSMGLLSEAQLEKRDGVIWALWALPPTLMAAVSDPKRFTPLDLEEIGKLDRYAAIALYEICARYRDNPTGLTSRNGVEWWTDALSNAPASLDPVTGQRNRREWRKFKREFVAPAIQEINRKTDLVIGLLEFKEVRTIKEAQFKVKRKPQTIESTLPKVAIELAELAAALVQFNYSCK